MRRFSTAIALSLIAVALTLSGQTRRATPVNTPATATQPINETSADTSRINARIRAGSTSYVDDRGLIIYVDTLTNREWTDSTLLSRVPKMEYPLLYTCAVGVDLWDAAMRAFGQKHGIASVMAELNMHNRYIAVAEAGVGQGAHRGLDDSYYYRSPLAPFFRIGLNYNFLYNSNPDYKFFAGVRYGFSPFSFAVDDVVVNSPYWQENSSFSIPSQHVTAGWLEFCLGLRVKIWGPVSAGWTFKYHTILHESACPHGKPWYIPGYGTRNGAITGAFHIVYTIPLHAPIPAMQTTQEQE